MIPASTEYDMYQGRKLESSCFSFARDLLVARIHCIHRLCEVGVFPWLGIPEFQVQKDFERITELDLLRPLQHPEKASRILTVYLYADFCMQY